MNTATCYMTETSKEATQSQTAKQYKTQIQDILFNFSRSYQRYLAAKKELNKIISFKSENMTAGDFICRLIDEWIEEKCDEKNRENPNRGHLLIEPAMLSEKIKNFRYPSSRSFNEREPEIKPGVSFYDAEVDELIHYFLDNYDFALLEDELNGCASSLERSSFEEAARAIGNYFNLFSDSIWNRYKELTLKKVKGKIEIEASYYSEYLYGRVQRIQQILTVTNTMESETGVYGLSSCLGAFIEEEHNRNIFEPGLPSRTRLNSGQDVEAVTYKGKVKFYFTNECFEAMVGFVQTFSGKALAKIKVS